jgi:hypothetical protein
MASQQEQIGSRIKPHVTVPRSLLRSTMHAMHMASQRKHMKLAPLRLQQTTLRPGLCCTQPLLSRTSRRVFWAADDADGHHGPSPQKIRRFHGMDTQFGSIWGDFWAVDIPGKKKHKKKLPHVHGVRAVYFLMTNWAVFWLPTSDEWWSP